MKPKEAMLTLDAARERLAYDPDTGAFYRNKTRKTVGYLSHKGYIRIDIGKNWYSGHRLAWLMTHGEWPTEQVDHINGNRADNRIENLRLADRNINAQNQREASAGCASGFLGVYPVGNRWKAQIRHPIERRIVYLGHFDTREEAHEAYVSKKRELHPGCTI